MDLKLVLESLLFSSQKPLSLKEFKQALAAAADQPDAGEDVQAYKKTSDADLEQALRQLEEDYSTAGRSFTLTCIAHSWQFVSQPAFVPWLKALIGEKTRPTRLSQPALETLAIIAYRQPLTRAEMEEIRGVSVDGVLQTLLERELVEQAGRAEVVGRPMTFRTTSQFLEYFGLRDLDELPAADELRRIVVEKPPELATTDTDPSQEPAANDQAEPEGSTPGPQPPAADEPRADEPEQRPQAGHESGSASESAS